MIRVVVVSCRVVSCSIAALGAPFAVACGRHACRHEHSEHGTGQLYGRRLDRHRDLQYQFRHGRRDPQRRPDDRQRDRSSVAGGDCRRAGLHADEHRQRHRDLQSHRALSAGVVGDDFDPTLASPAIYFDTDNSGDFSGGDLAYNPGVNDPALAADASVRLIVVNSIPNTVVNGNRGRSQLTAAAATGTGAPGTSFGLVGDGGVEAVAGTTGGDAAAVRRIPRRGRAAHRSEDAGDRRPVRRRDDRCLARASTTRSS